MFSLIGSIAIHKSLGAGIVTNANTDYVFVKFDRDGRQMEFGMDVFRGLAGDYFLQPPSDFQQYENMYGTINAYKAQDRLAISEDKEARELNVLKNKINNDIILTLTYQIDKKYIDIDTFVIEKPLRIAMIALAEICNRQADHETLDEIENFLKASHDFRKLHGTYRYCVSLSLPYQGVSADIFGLFKQIKSLREDLLIRERDQNKLCEQINKKKKLQHDVNSNIKPDDETDVEWDLSIDDEYDDAEVNNDRSNYLFANINEFSKQLIKDSTLWCEANAIHKAYRHCYDNKRILTFSHRICGWSNPVHKLTENFSIELKTNFGYGKSSYFYTKIKYKDIEVIPFSDWIKYRKADASEIIRYTQSYKLENEYWYDALTFAKDACNISLSNEELFVKKYIIDECEKMVNGLVDIFNNDYYFFEGDGKGYESDLKGRVLITFRGEKISGALSFISKIIELCSIIEVSEFISKIETCNKLLQPILVTELNCINIEVEQKYLALKPLREKYIELCSARNYYSNQQNLMRDEYLKKNAAGDFLEFDYNFDYSKIEKEFNLRFPEFIEFMIEYKELGNDISILEQQISHLEDTYEVIKNYDSKIVLYFNEKNKSNALPLVGLAPNINSRSGIINS